MSLRQAPISELVDFAGRGQSPTYSDQETSTLAINQKCIRDGRVNVELARYHVDRIKVKTNAILEVGDICLNSTGTGTIGRVGLWADNNVDKWRSAFVDSHVTILKPKHDKVNSKYLATLLQSPPVQNVLEIFCYSGSTNQIELARSALLELDLHLLPRAEQDTVAGIFELIDQLIDQFESLITKHESIKTGLMQDLLTNGVDKNGQIRSEATHEFKNSPCGRIPVEWDCRTMQQVCHEIVVGIVIRPAQYYKPSGVSVFRSANIRENRIDASDMVYMSAADNNKLSKSIVKTGNLLTVRTGYPGTTAVVPEEFDGSNCVDVIISRPNTEIALPQFLSFWMNSHLGKKQVIEGQGGLAQQHFNVSRMKNLAVRLPGKEEQIKIVQVLAQQENLIFCFMCNREKLIRLKAGLMRELLSGKLMTSAAETGEMQEPAVGAVA